MASSAPGLRQTSQSNYRSFSNTPETVSDSESDDDVAIKSPLPQRRLSTAVDAPLPPHIAEPDATVKIIYTILGAATLLSWNAIITVTPWYIFRMKGSPIQPAFMSYLSVSCQISNFVALAHATATVKSVPKTRRIRMTCAALAVLMATMFILTWIPTHPTVFFVFVLANAVSQSIVCSYFSSSVVATSSYFGPIAMQALMTGQAAVAVIISLIQVIITSLSLDDNPVKRREEKGRAPEDNSASLFFFLTFTGLLVALLAHAYLVRLPIYRNVAAPFEMGKVIETEEEEGLMTSTVGSLREIEPVLPVDPRQVAKTNLTYNLSVMFVYVVTLALYPAITAAVHSVNPPSYSPLSNPLLLNAVHFLIFNAGDWIGRFICSFSPFQVWSRRRIALLSLSRVIFVPLFLACNVEGGANSNSDSGGSSPLINSDFVFFSILLLFGITNGHVTSVSMMAAASLEHNKRLRKEQVDTAAVIAQFSLAAGLVLGSIANFGIRARICNCNPFLH